MKYKIIKPSIIQSSMMNNDAMIKEFVELYLRQCPIDFQSLTESIKAKDPYAIRSAAHHIKPTMEYIGATELRIDFQELENLGKEGLHFDQIETKYKDISVKFDLMLNELKDFIA